MNRMALASLASSLSVGVLWMVGFGGEAAARKAPSKYQVCKKDNNCVFVPSICPRCAPCKLTWRSVGNRKMLRWIRSMQTRVDCALPRCKKCSNRKNWLGTRAVCFRKRCTVAPLQKKLKTIPADLKCKRHKDCGLWPRSNCLCRPCGLRWRRVANRRALRRERLARSVQGQCLKNKCKRCARRALGKRALCVRGRCTAR